MKVGKFSVRYYWETGKSSTGDTYYKELWSKSKNSNRQYPDYIYIAPVGDKWYIDLRFDPIESLYKSMYNTAAISLRFDNKQEAMDHVDEFLNRLSKLTVFL